MLLSYLQRRWLMERGGRGEMDVFLNKKGDLVTYFGTKDGLEKEVKIPSDKMLEVYFGFNQPQKTS